ncbi:semaphorin-4G-like [Boleophthalmus pectinirostris]|uniref:semaphorin-4G-like n=1 Tax=Boleophthalmus pectinirostris TaxID=150288 RepID=UPI0024333379|nr:semaphorin-4G-like [Boleophthalmus pectinirostris]XP_055018333.1 semaphorin-4G-like [Boleophthalmus pectinirostris]
MSPALPLCLRLLLLCSWAGVVLGYPFRTPVELDVTPRITVPVQGLHGSRRFLSSAVNHSVLLLEPESERLYVGARGAVFALNASDISSPFLQIEWEASPEQKQQCLTKGKDNKTECFNHIRLLQRFNSTHLYMCGTHAFRPLCAFIDEKSFEMSPAEDGRDKCPYGPTTGYTGLIIDQQIYTASQYEFRSFPDIRRNSPSPTLRTEDAPTRWLTEADFVGSALVRESINSPTGDDDKIYFFFTESAEENSAAYSGGSSRVARVARVCKGDRGGHLTLQKRWTSFLKARLVCSLPEFNFHFNMLRSVFILPDPTPKNTLFFGIFGLEWKNVKASAVCSFSLSEVEKAFLGPYMETQDSGSNWKEYSGKIPDPRPGTCITDSLRARGINMSTSLPDDVLYFVRRHPLMSVQVQPTDRRPLLFRRTTDYTQLAVHVTQAADEQEYHVLYLGTDDGWLHKAVQVQGQLHIIEELQLLEEPEPVSSVLISTEQMSVYVSFPSGVLQLPLSTCHRYTSCYDCVFSRDPHCAWDGDSCVDILHVDNRSALIQDIQHGSRGCENYHQVVMEKSRSVRVGDDVLLQCELTSNLASPTWTQDGRDLTGYGLSSGVRTGNDGLLIIDAKSDQSGRYTCYSVENDIRVPIISYNITVEVDTPTVKNIELTEDLSIYTLPSPEEPIATEQPLIPPPAPRLTTTLLDPQNMEALYLTLITILGGLCVVLTVVLLYVGFCLRVGNRGKYSLRAAAAAYPSNKRVNKNRKHRNSATMELKTISSHCNGYANGSAKHHNGDIQNGGFLQIVPGEGHTTFNRDSPPPAPPLPPTPNHTSPDCDFPNGLSATLPSMLRRINGNSYVLLRQTDSANTSPNGYSFTDELNKILEKRKHTQILPRPDESSV